VPADLPVVLPTKFDLSSIWKPQRRSDCNLGQDDGAVRRSHRV